MLWARLFGRKSRYCVCFPYQKSYRLRQNERYALYTMIQLSNTDEYLVLMAFNNPESPLLVLRSQISWRALSVYLGPRQYISDLEEFSRRISSANEVTPSTVALVRITKLYLSTPSLFNVRNIKRILGFSYPIRQSFELIDLNFEQDVASATFLIPSGESHKTMEIPISHGRGDSLYLDVSGLSMEDRREVERWMRVRPRLSASINSTRVPIKGRLWFFLQSFFRDYSPAQWREFIEHHFTIAKNYFDQARLELETSSSKAAPTSDEKKSGDLELNFGEKCFFQKSEICFNVLAWDFQDSAAVLKEKWDCEQIIEFQFNVDKVEVVEDLIRYAFNSKVYFGEIREDRFK